MTSDWLHQVAARLRGFTTKRARRRLRQQLRASNRRRLGLESLEDRRLLVASLSINDPAIVEGNSGTTNLNFTVSRGGDDTLSNVTVAYSTQDGTATAGSDYTATSGAVTIPSGATTATISVPVLGDTTVESDEQFLVNLTGITNVTGPAVTLAAKSDLATGNNPRSVAIGDVNGDGKPDLAVANYGSNSVSVLLNRPATISDNQGSGTITNDDVAGTLSATLDGSGNLTITDIDATGKNNALHEHDPDEDGFQQRDPEYDQWSDTELRRWHNHVERREHLHRLDDR